MAAPASRTGPAGTGAHRGAHGRRGAFAGHLHARDPARGVGHVVRMAGRQPVYLYRTRRHDPPGRQARADPARDAFAPDGQHHAGAWLGQPSTGPGTGRRARCADARLGGDRGRAREAASAWALAARSDLALQRTRLLASTAQAYVEAQAASETLSLRMELLEIANNSADAIQARVEAGRASPIERNRAEMLVGLATIAANDASGAQLAANAQLVAIWSGAVINGELTPPLQAFDLTAYSDAQPTDWIANNPELVQLRAVTRARGQEIRRERAGAIPDVTVGAGVRRFGGTDETAFVATLEIPIPVVNRNQGGVAAAASRENAARLNEEVMRRSLIAQYASSAGRFARAQSTYTQLNDSILPASESALGAAQEAYREGALDVLNFLDIQRSYFDVRVDLISARAELARAAIELDALAGAPQLNRLVETNPEEAVQ